VIELIPWAPAFANALRSAWMPAPPPESDPAMVSNLGSGAAMVAQDRHRLPPGRSLVGAQPRALHQPVGLQPGERGAGLAHAQAGRGRQFAQVAPGLDALEHRLQRRVARQ